MRIRKTLIALVIFLILYFSLNYLSRPTGYILDKNWFLTVGNNTIEIQLPYYDYPNKSGLVTFKTSFNKPNGDTLVIPKISCYAYRIYINDVKVLQVGDFGNPTANIWNYSHVINLDKKIFKDKNDLTIEAYVLDDIGMHISPFIDREENVMSRISIFNFINNDIYLIMLGISGILAALMIVISMPNRANKIMYLYFSLAIIFASIYSFDCIYRISSGNISNFLSFRKILFSSFYASGIFLILGIEKYIGKNSRFRNILFGAVAVSILLVLVSSDFIELRSRINILNILAAISPIYVIALILKNKKKQFYFSTNFLTLILVYTVMSVVYKANNPYLLPYGIIIFALGLSVSLILEFTNIYIEKNNIYLKSVTDYLTNAFNRNILEEIDMDLNDMLILIDIDNFKYYNDTFGHRRGDILLVEIVNIIKSHIRKDDFIIRLGGDEFLIILKNADENIASNTVSKIQNEFRSEIDNENIDISFGVLRYQSDFEKAYNQVDEKMYKMKASKKFN